MGLAMDVDRPRITRRDSAVPGRWERCPFHRGIRKVSTEFADGMTCVQAILNQIEPLGGEIV